jgi:hypothetical protein
LTSRPVTAELRAYVIVAERAALLKPAVRVARAVAPVPLSMTVVLDDELVVLELDVVELLDDVVPPAPFVPDPPAPSAPSRPSLPSLGRGCGTTGFAPLEPPVPVGRAVTVAVRPLAAMTRSPFALAATDSKTSDRPTSSAPSA